MCKERTFVSVTTPFADQLGQLKSRAFSEFNDVGDFIWKSPRFLIHETTLEKEKLKDYFPEGGETARLRWQHESAKLGSTFPYLIAIGNLFSATSLFETYLLLLVELLQETTTITIDKTKGQGFPRACTYLRTNFVSQNLSRFSIKSKQRSESVTAWPTPVASSRTSETGGRCAESSRMAFI
jgi:hypothetical protein